MSKGSYLFKFDFTGMYFKMFGFFILKLNLTVVSLSMYSFSNLSTNNPSKNIEKS